MYPYTFIRCVPKTILEQNVTAAHSPLVPRPCKAGCPGPSPKQSGPSRAAQSGLPTPTGTAPRTSDTVSPLKKRPRLRQQSQGRHNCTPLHNQLTFYLLHPGPTTGQPGQKSRTVRVLTSSILLVVVALLPLCHLS